MIDLRDIDSDSLLLARKWEMRNHGASSGASRGLEVSKMSAQYKCHPACKVEMTHPFARGASEVRITAKTEPSICTSSPRQSRRRRG
jgi:hypothetical protein